MSFGICSSIIFLTKDPLGKTVLLNLYILSIVFNRQAPGCSLRLKGEKKKKLEFFDGNEFDI